MELLYPKKTKASGIPTWFRTVAMNAFFFMFFSWVLNCCRFFFTCIYIYITIYTSYVSLHHMFHYVICFTASYVSLRHMFHCVICFTAFPAGIQAESEVGSMAIRLAFMLKSPNRAP